MKYIARSKMDGTAGGMYKVYPIYDWKDTDVWLFIKEHNLDFPESYMDLYAVGQNRGNLRMCNYFAAESIAGLRQIAEIDPQLWDKIERREPNAYLTLLYWDSEMFKRSTRKRARLEKELDKKDYKALLKDMLFRDFDITFTTHARRRVAEQYKRMYIKMDGYLKPKHYKDMYECLVAGDPKLRSIRAIWTNIGTSLSDQARAEVKSRKGAASHA
jgi:predicted phosphoadenosine phosphosulfate sulfurtransferase